MSQNIFAQLTITTNQIAAALVNKLSGPGVITLNPTLNCAGAANGIFTAATGTNLGIDSGIILTTGAASAVANPASYFASQNNGYAGDTQLDAISGDATHDACVLEFDFVPSGDSVSFNYVFGSEEYPNFVNSGVNDAFGFFISGSGITGTQNMAVVPMTVTPITINTINANTNSQYFIDNATAEGQYVAYNGYTTVMTARSTVQPCDTYHLKLAIADGGDFIYDSGVFLGSLSSPTYFVSARGINTDSTVGAMLIRGCPAGKVKVQRNPPYSDTLSLAYDLGGDAVNGTDYTYLNGHIFFNVGDSIATVNIEPLPINPPEGPKNVWVKIRSPYTCTTIPYIDSTELEIYDSLALNLIPSTTTPCFGLPLTVVVEYDTAYGALDYQWLPAANVSAPTIDSAVITESVPGLHTYTLTASIASYADQCRVSTGSLTVDFQKVTVDIGPDSTICDNEKIMMYAGVTPEYLNNTYVWKPESHFSDNTLKNPIYISDSSATVTIKVTTPQGCSAADTMIMSVHPSNFVMLTIPDTNICPGDTIQMRGLTNGASYLWSPANSVDSATQFDTRVFPTNATEYVLYSTSVYGCVDTDSVYVNVNPGATIALPDTGLVYAGQSYEISPLTNATTFQWSPTSGLNYDNISTPIANPTVNTRYYVLATTDLGCSTTDSIDIIVDYKNVLEVPNGFRAGGGDNLKVIIHGNYKLKDFSIYNRWGNLVFESANADYGWDGSYKSNAAPIGVYVYHVIAIDADGKEIEKSGNITLLR